MFPDIAGKEVRSLASTSDCHGQLDLGVKYLENAVVMWYVLLLLASRKARRSFLLGVDSLRTRRGSLLWFGSIFQGWLACFDREFSIYPSTCILDNGWQPHN